MEFKPNNLYKLHLNNQNNIISGVGTSKFSLNLPLYFPQNKQCYVYVEYAKLQIKSAVGQISGDNFCLNSNLISQNSYSNNNKSQSGVLCYFGSQRIKGNPTTTINVELNIATNPILVGHLPSQIELFISNPISVNEGDPIVLESDLEISCTLCCQYID